MLGENKVLKNRRSEIEIISKILNVSRQGARKTEILYQGNLSYMQLQSYLPFLIEKDILFEETVANNGSSYKKYKLTDKGSNLYNDIQKVLVHLS